MDLALGLHMIYFATDVADNLQTMIRFVKPGGAFFSVATDDATAYGGVVLGAYLPQTPRVVAASPKPSGLRASISRLSRCASQAGCTGTHSGICWLWRSSVSSPMWRARQSSRAPQRFSATGPPRSTFGSRPRVRVRACGAWPNHSG